MGLFDPAETLAEAIGAYLVEHADNLRPETAASYQRGAAQLLRKIPDLVDVPIADFDGDHMWKISERFDHNTSMGRVRTVIAGAIDRAIRLGLRGDYNPARSHGISKSKQRSKRPHDQLIDAFIPAIDALEADGRWSPMLADFYRLAAIWGFRHREIMRLRPSDVDLSIPSIFLVIRKNRGKILPPDEEYPIGPWAAEILGQRIEQAAHGYLFWGPEPSHRKWREGYPGDHFAKLVGELDDRGVDVVDRVTGARILPSITRSIAARVRLRANLPLPIIQHTMAQRKVQTTLSYAPCSTEEARKAMLVVESRLGTHRSPPTQREALLGANIKSRRQKLKKSMETCASAAGLTRQGWAQWEHHGCPLARLDDVAQILGSTPGDLLGLVVINGAKGAA
jgi:integrase